MRKKEAEGGEPGSQRSGQPPGSAQRECRAEGQGWRRSARWPGRDGGSGWSAMALGEYRVGPTDATGRSAQARGRERWSSQGLRETVGVCGFYFWEFSLPPAPVWEWAQDWRCCGVGLAYGMDWVKVGLAVRPV